MKKTRLKVWESRFFMLYLQQKTNFLTRNAYEKIITRDDGHGHDVHQC